MPAYDLSPEAEDDILNIYRYSVTNFGKAKAQHYFQGIHESLATLALNPQAGRNRDELRPELLSFVIEQHVAFYRIVQNRIFIVRVFHSKQDIPNRLFN